MKSCAVTKHRSHICSDYAATISAKALIDRASGALPSDIASIAGKRLVTMSEFPERTPINTTTVKSVTGGDRVTARHIYKDWFEFRPQFQLVYAMNELQPCQRLCWPESLNARGR